ncbi:hypothetical protein E4T38_06936 [Aureobasidium subglaciale]|nr:hypothetical protein E4T38_06936 [Aureobasidium subglaciale]KAI5218483.1 hypothetical protein E4T40_06867 [Aureobasidium subglaciale]KAI5222154.1 hypothetical protein E4T41_06787 [Aureobasidium subglaciale]KAI5259712.1 hypothetical protein E4T46_06765 [Aureobasidium subglaciale]
MPSNSPLDPKAAVFVAKQSTKSSKQLNPKAPAFVSYQTYNRLAQGIYQQLQASYIGYLCQIYDTTEPESPTVGIFSIPLELRLRIYEQILDEEYEIHETGVPALLRTRLQITREYYQLCTLRIVLVRERRIDATRRRFPALTNGLKLGKSLVRRERDKIEKHRVWEHWEKIMDFGMTIPRRDLFVHIRIEAWCKHAAMYPEKALRSHGQCRDCKVRRLERSPWTCRGWQSFLAVAVLYVLITGVLFGMIYLLKKKMPQGEDARRWRCLVH